MFQPVKIAFGEYMAGFYAGLVPTTKGMHEFVSRGFANSVAWTPGRMIDAAEEMLSLWHRNDPEPSSTNSTKPPNTPSILVSMASDFTPTMRDFAYQIVNDEPFTFQDDAKERIFTLRTISGDIRIQAAIFAHDEPTARSIAAQFLLYQDRFRRFRARYRFAGMDRLWPVQIESPDSPAMNIQTDAKNLTIMVVDMTLKVTVPLFKAPLDTEPNDGKGTDGDIDDPHGFPDVSGIEIDGVELRR